jgi:hypothetical protein
MKLGLKGLEDHEIKAISDANNSIASEVIIRLATKLRDTLRTDVEDNPQRCNEDLTKDWVYITGAVSALNAIAEAQKQAESIITKRRPSS